MGASVDIWYGLRAIITSGGGGFFLWTTKEPCPSGAYTYPLWRWFYYSNKWSYPVTRRRSPDSWGGRVVAAFWLSLLIKYTVVRRKAHNSHHHQQHQEEEEAWFANWVTSSRIEKLLIKPDCYSKRVVGGGDWWTFAASRGWQVCQKVCMLLKHKNWTDGDKK